MQFLRKYAWVYALVLAASVVLSVAASESVTLVSKILDGPEPVPLTVVIDPGHGGEDGGAVSCTGALESRINLSIGLRLNDLLRLLGYRTRLTRSEDVSIYSKDAETVSEKKVSDLKNRVRIVNETEHALLLSVHQNLFEEAKYHGAQVFYAGTSESIELAEAIQSALRAGLDPYIFRTAARLQDEIRNERARELFGEFQRKFDLVRWGIFYQSILDYSDYQALKDNVKPCHEYYPIPDLEVVKSKYNLDNKEYAKYGL